MVLRPRFGLRKSLISSLGALLLVIILTISARPHSASQLHSRSVPSEPLDLFQNVTSHIVSKRSTYTDRQTKGRQLQCRMQATIAEAAAMNGGTSMEAEIQDPNYMEMEGWQFIEDSKVPYFGTYLQSAFDALGIDSSNNVIRDQQNLVVGMIIPLDDDLDDGNTDFGETMITRARFENVINAQGGAIIADKNESPMAMGFPKSDYISRVYQWSDAAFLQWADVCKSAGVDVSSLNYIFRATVINQDTQDMVITALQANNVEAIPVWANKITYTLADNPDEFYAILGSKNGAGCAYLLLQHKAKLGIKHITSVTFWSSTIAYPISSYAGTDTTYLKLQMYFTVEDYTAS